MSLKCQRKMCNSYAINPIESCDNGYWTVFKCPIDKKKYRIPIYPPCSTKDEMIQFTLENLEQSCNEVCKAFCEWEADPNKLIELYEDLKAKHKALNEHLDDVYRHGTIRDNY